jgi:pimeloyl-ACP methyl ester carboxylesterase
VAETSAATAEVEYTFSPVGTITPMACPEYTNLAAVAENEVEGETYECGLVTVPENHTNPAGRTIELLYFRMFSPSDSPAPDPLLYLSGGPGGSGLSEMNPALSIILANLQTIRQDRDVVVYDQRGTGFSSPLLCGPTEAAIGAAAELLPERADDIREIEGDEV